MVPVTIEEDSTHILDEDDELHEEDYDYHSNSSDDSAGKTTFARTPEHSDNEESGFQGDTPTCDYPIQRDTPTNKDRDVGTTECEKPSGDDSSLKDLSKIEAHSMKKCLSPLPGRPLNQNGLGSNRNRPLPPIPLRGVVEDTVTLPITTPLSSEISSSPLHTSSVSKDASVDQSHQLLSLDKRNSLDRD